MFRRLAAVGLLTVASLGFALRFRPPPTVVDSFDETMAEVVAIEPPAAVTRPSFAPLPSVVTTTIPPLPPGIQQFESGFVRFGRGVMQLRITLDLGVLVDIEMVRVPHSSERAKSTNLEAEPILRAEALELQGYRLHVVSGATETTYGYARALRSAFEEADFCVWPRCELLLR